MPQSHRLIAAAALLTSAAAAQSPRITPAGDPSVRADTIYRLAVDASTRPKTSTVTLLDDGVIRVEASGRRVTTYRQIIQILDSEAVKNFEEEYFTYAPRHQRFTLNWIRVVKPDGTVISDAPANVEESDAKGSGGDSTYSDSRSVTASVSGVAVGTIVDRSVTTEELQPYLPGDFFLTWYENTTNSLIKRSRYIVDVPAETITRIREENLRVPRTETTVNGRRVYTWTDADIPKVVTEDFAADSNGVNQYVWVSSSMTWSGIGKWYADNARSRYVATPLLDSVVASAVLGARTLDDSIRDLHRWVAQDIGYAALSIGVSGYQPRSPDDVIRTGTGDARDKTTLFVAAMQRLGVRTFPVLVNTAGNVKGDLPSIEQINHVIAAFKRPPKTTYDYVDLSAEFVPLGLLPGSLQGSFGVVVHPDGTVEPVKLPVSAIAANRDEVHIAGTLTEDGEFTGRYVTAVVGDGEPDLRKSFQGTHDSTQLANVANNLATALFPGAKGDSLVLFDGKDFSRPVRATLVIRGQAASITGTTGVLTTPFGNMASMDTSARDLESAGPRRFPIDASKMFGPSDTRTEFRVTLPEGWTAQLPPGVDATSVFGTYRLTYTQTGRELVMSRTIIGSRSIVPPARLPELTAWLRAIARDNAHLIVIEKKH